MKPSKKLTERALPDSRPEKAVKEYFLSKSGERLPARRPEWDVARNSPEMELVVARRHLGEAEIKLAEKRLEQEIRRKEMDEQWDQLKEKEVKLRESFHHFQKFVKENQEKRDRAKLKMKEEHELQSLRDHEIEKLSGSVEQMGMVKRTIEQHLISHKIYEDYLNKVVAESSDCDTIQDILNRYETLTSARINLTETQEKALNEMETARNEMLQLTKEKSSVVVTLNSHMAQLQNRYTTAHSQAARWEAAVDRIKEVAVEKKNEITQVKNSCWRLYEQICKRKGVPISFDQHDHENQLMFIKSNILELRKVVRIATNRATRRAGSRDVQGSMASLANSAL